MRTRTLPPESSRDDAASELDEATNTTAVIAASVIAASVIALCLTRPPGRAELTVLIDGHAHRYAAGWADRRAVVVGVSLLPVFHAVSLARE